VSSENLLEDLPEHVVLNMPALSPTMTEGKIMSYHVEVGDSVEAGDSIASVETDKATMEFEVQDEGFIAWLNTAQVGQTTKLGQPCAVLVESKDDIPKFANFSPSASKKEVSTPSPSPTQTQSESPSTSAPSPQTSEETHITEKVFISPRALNTLLSQGYTKSDLQAKLSDLSRREKQLGSGPNNRIISQDVPRIVDLLKQPVQEVKPKTTSVQGVDGKMTVTGEYREVELSTMRRVIAERLSQSKREIPHYYLEAEVRMDSLLEMKKEVQAKAGVKLSVNDFIVKAVAKASREVPDCNTNFVDNKIRYFENVDVR
jgi:pyruvate dehydrogenase E2 component (dihydrolipoamide acetyltransferase)